MTAEASFAWEETLVFLKPETVMRELTGRMLTRFEENGLNLVAV